MEIVNGIELYDITENALGKYREQAKNQKNLPLEILKRKLTSMVLNSYGKKIESENDVKVLFGGCYIHINEKLKLITDIGWFNEEHSSCGLIESRISKFIRTNITLGLNKKGTNFAKSE